MAANLEHQMGLNSFELLGIAIKFVLKWEITYEYHLYINLCYISPILKNGENFLFKGKCFTLQPPRDKCPPQSWRVGWNISSSLNQRRHSDFF